MLKKELKVQEVTEGSFFCLFFFLKKESPLETSGGRFAVSLSDAPGGGGCCFWKLLPFESGVWEEGGWRRPVWGARRGVCGCFGVGMGMGVVVVVVRVALLSSSPWR